MSSRPWIVIAVATVVLLATALGLYQNKRSASSQALSVTTRSALLPNLQSELPTLSRIELLEYGGVTVSMQRDEDMGWSVDQADQYYADLTKLRAWLLSLVDAKVLETKTDNPDYYAKLGIASEDVSVPTQQIVLFGADQEAPIAELYVGHTIRNDSATYVRVLPTQQVLLADTQLNPAHNPLAWVERTVLDIDKADIQRVAVHNVSEPTWQMSRTVPEELDFDVDNLPIGQSLASPGSLKAISMVLGNLQLNDVRRAEVWLPETTPQAERSTTVFDTFDGRVIKVANYKADSEHWIQFWLGLDEARASHYFKSKALASKRLALPANQEVVVKLSETEQQSVDASVQLLKQTVESQQARLQGWAFQVPDYKYNNLFRSLQDFL